MAVERRHLFTFCRLLKGLHCPLVDTLSAVFHGFLSAHRSHFQCRLWFIFAQIFSYLNCHVLDLQFRKKERAQDLKLRGNLPPVPFFPMNWPMQREKILFTFVVNYWMGLRVIQQYWKMLQRKPDGITPCRKDTHAALPCIALLAALLLRSLKYPWVKMGRCMCIKSCVR